MNKVITAIVFSLVSFNANAASWNCDSMGGGQSYVLLADNQNGSILGGRTPRFGTYIKRSSIHHVWIFSGNSNSWNITVKIDDKRGTGVLIAYDMQGIAKRATALICTILIP